MCGIAGLFRPGGGDESALVGYARRMATAVSHRGPDASGIWANAAAGIAFGHRRLSILDLSEAGSQPMRSECGRFAVTFNGEIYNHLDIRNELDATGGAQNWRGHSDTETMLYAVRQWGVAAALQRFIGMFAFALWDERERTLTLCRDRFGEKPLFYGWCGADLVFASELKALATHPQWSPSLDRAALTAFMRYSYIPAPSSIWTGIKKLPCASFVTFTADATPGALPASEPYWLLREQVLAGRGMGLTNEAEATEELERLLSVAVKRQCLSDVPLGAFLSGGIDSSTIVSLMQAQASQPVRTFTIGFRESAFDEADDARKVAAHLGTSHTALYVDPKTAMDVIPKLSRMYDEPFADSSQIPTHLVSVLARQHVTVALSGDAGDELFGGYNRHIWGGQLNKRFGNMPASLKQALSALLGAVSPEPAGTLARWTQPLLPSRFNVRRAGDQVAKLARIAGSSSFDQMYQLLCSIDSEPSQTVVRGEENACWSTEEMDKVETPLDPLDRMTLADSLSYLTDDILQKVDRAAMAVGLETRVPFLDKDVVEFAARVDPDMKVRDGRGKWLVRQVLYRHVPAELVDRPKTGFSIPLDDWLRGPLKSWASDLLSPTRLKSQDLFSVERVRSRLDEHMSGRRNHGYWLWNVLMAQAWHDTWSSRQSKLSIADAAREAIVAR
jgi:asparagine synthase (glutamine-hydrolysing)